MYVLTVEPKTKHKFLYRGRIRVDADDFAVIHVESSMGLMIVKTPQKNTEDTRFIRKKARELRLGVLP
jgi:hypothetical protein